MTKNKIAKPKPNVKIRMTVSRTLNGLFAPKGTTRNVSPATARAQVLGAKCAEVYDAEEGVWHPPTSNKAAEVIEAAREAYNKARKAYDKATKKKSDKDAGKDADNGKEGATDGLDDKTVDELKDMLRDADMKVSGDKAALIARLRGEGSDEEE